MSMNVNKGDTNKDSRIEIILSMRVGEKNENSCIGLLKPNTR